MHSQPEIFRTELAKILATDCERIEIVLLKISSKFAPALLVFSPKESGNQKQQRDNNRCDHIDAELALQGIYHGNGRNIGILSVCPTGLQPAVHHSYVPATISSTNYRFPARLERLIFSSATSAGRESA